MDSSKEIKVYGTLVNWTLNNEIMDNTHNDAVALARQLYDDRFGVTPNADNFQDVINKRVTAISYADGVTTIKNRTGIADGVPYMFVVDGASNLHGNTTITGNERVDGNESVGGTMTVTGATTLNNTLHTTGKVTADSGIDIADGNLDVQNGNAHVKKNLTVDGTANIAGATTLQSTLNVTGTSTLGVVNEGATTAASMLVTGNSTVNGNEHVLGTLTVDGETTLDNNLHVTGDADIDGDTTIVGNTSVGEDLSVHDNISCDTLNVANNAHVGGILDVFHLMPMNGLTVTGTAMFNDNVEIDGKLDVPNGEISGKTLHITTNGSIDGTTTTNKLVVTEGGAHITGNSDIAGTLTVSGNVSSPNVNTVISDVATLNSNKNTPGSVDYKVELLYQKILVGIDPQAIDSLNDILAWIMEHLDDAAAMLRAIQALLDSVSSLSTNKQDKLTFDNTPTSGSTNPVKSGGIYSFIKALDATVQLLAGSDGLALKTVLTDGILTSVSGSISMDSTPTAGSTKTVTSGGIKTALDTKQGTLTFDSTPTSGSSNPVTSGGIYTTLANYVTTLALTDLANRVSTLETEVDALKARPQYWTLNSTQDKIVSGYGAQAAGFYDSTVS